VLQCVADARASIQVVQSPYICEHTCEFFLKSKSHALQSKWSGIYKYVCVSIRAYVCSLNFFNDRRSRFYLGYMYICVCVHLCIYVSAILFFERRNGQLTREGKPKITRACPYIYVNVHIHIRRNSSRLRSNNKQHSRSRSRSVSRSRAHAQTNNASMN